MSDARRNLLARLQALDAVLARSPLRLGQGSLGSPGGWFLGPKAENKDLLLELIAAAVAEHCGYRASYHPEDPEIITEAVKQSTEYVQAVAALRTSAAELNATLKRSAPIFSMRSHGHMLWDQVLPAMVGYFAGMLYNQNNVAAEASPITTWLEIQVANDLCRMLGYDVPAEGCAPQANAIVPWGHITCGGSVANIEALWAARNAKFFAVAVQAALREVPALAAARDIDIGLLDGTKARLIELDVWTLLNLMIDDVVALPHRIAALCGHDTSSAVTDALKSYTLQNIGFVDFYRRFLPLDSRPPIALAAATGHYSWPKGGTILGIGRNGIRKVRVDLCARMHISDLECQLRECLRTHTPVLSVVAVIGSTEESAVDPLRKILDVRQDFRREGLDFAVHCDAAWGGYFNSMYRDEDAGLGFMAAAPEFPMSRYVAEQYRALREADSITVDPHKAGFVPYPAGSICYRNSALRDLISLAAPVVFHNQLEPTVGIYGIEGSKPGAAAAAVYLAHKVIRPTKQGYGKILAQCVWTSKRMYCRLLTMQDRDPRQPSPFKIELFQMLPAERDGLGPEAVARQRALVTSFVGLDNEKLLARLNAEPDAKALFEELGSDQVILAYAFNFRDPETGEWNTDPDKMNALNNRIYEICSISDPGRDPSTVDLIVTGSTFDVESYGKDFVDHFSSRLGVHNPDDKSIAFLISTTMNPWTTDTSSGDFLEVVERALRDAVYKAGKEDPRGIGAAALPSGHRAHSPAPAANGRSERAHVRRHAFAPAAGAGHHHPSPDDDKVVSNERHFHAFALLGEERLFASHLTMLDVEVHMYQFIIEVGLPEPWRSEYVKERRAHPKDSYFLANALEDAQIGNHVSDPMTVPEVQSRLRTCFVGNIFRGIPYKQEYSDWPWLGVKPVLANIPVTVERIVHFRPFAQSMNPPSTLSYLLFGAGREAHMANYQTKKPDFDHVLSLQSAPDWLAPDLLAAGVIVDLPDLPRIGAGDHGAGVRCANPLKDIEEVDVRYRGTGNRRPVRLGQTYWFCTRVANHPDPCPGCNQPCGSPTPPEWLST